MTITAVDVISTDTEPGAAMAGDPLARPETHGDAWDRPTLPEGDEEMLRRVAAGDREALAALYDRHAPTLLAVARRMLGNTVEAEDVVHDCYLEAWLQAHTYVVTRGSARAWLVMRLRSRALDRLRAARSTRRIAEKEERSEVDLDAVDPALGTDYMRVRRVVALLPDDQRTVLDLAYFEGLSLVEIGERLAVPTGTVKSRLSRALEKLREAIRAQPAIF